MNTQNLGNRTCYNTNVFSLTGREFIAKVVSIYDGDTMTCIIEMFPETFYQVKFRLFGIDTPELNGDNVEQAIQARNRVICLVTSEDIQNIQSMSRKDIKALLNMNQYFVKIQCHHFDKYGRVLADVYTIDNPNETINQILLREHLAVEMMNGSCK